MTRPIRRLVIVDARSTKKATAPLDRPAHPRCLVQPGENRRDHEVRTRHPRRSRNRHSYLHTRYKYCSSRMDRRPDRRPGTSERCLSRRQRLRPRFAPDRFAADPHEARLPIDNLRPHRKPQHRKPRDHQAGRQILHHEFTHWT